MQKQLNIKDVTKRFVKSIRFCWISYSGCLGPSGYMFFMDSKGILYSCNFDYEKSKEYIKPEELCKKCKEYGLDIDLKSIRGIKDWDSFYLGGCGNYLYVNPNCALDFYRLTNGRSSLELFQYWKDIASYILCTQKGTR